MFQIFNATLKKPKNMKKILSMLLLLCLLSACTKDDAKSYIYWSDLTQEQYREINALILSVPCTDISDFEIVYRNTICCILP